MELKARNLVEQGVESPWDGKLGLAAKVHYSFMTRSYRDRDFDIDVAMKPLDLIGGDYCSINVRDDNRVLLCMCDVVGHDIVSALLSSRINTLATMTHIGDGDPCGLLESINDFLCDNLGDTGIYASLFCVLIDRNSRRFSYAGAAHPPALHFCA
ncbi:MAG: SpoIIE family protein phosphatase, partial [Gammaproteobacteria bacterium]|nr:SpoIIE family protein phosphatase [Gammaproteobacteria bacterium]